MTATVPAAVLLASNPGPAAHIALLAVVVIIGLIVFAMVRRRNMREAAETQRLDDASRTQRHNRGADNAPPSDPGHNETSRKETTE
jgi:uncharacterized protein HemX